MIRSFGSRKDVNVDGDVDPDRTGRLCCGHRSRFERTTVAALVLLRELPLLFSGALDDASLQ